MNTPEIVDSGRDIQDMPPSIKVKRDNQFRIWVMQVYETLPTAVRGPIEDFLDEMRAQYIQF